MAAPIGPGDWVECVDDCRATRPDSPLMKRRIYRVREVLDDAAGNPGVTLYGMECRQRWLGYALRLFRPVYRPREHAFDHLLENIPADLREDA